LKRLRPPEKKSEIRTRFHDLVLDYKEISGDVITTEAITFAARYRWLEELINQQLDEFDNEPVMASKRLLGEESADMQVEHDERVLAMADVISSGAVPLISNHMDAICGLDLICTPELVRQIDPKTIEKIRAQVKACLGSKVYEESRRIRSTRPVRSIRHVAGNIPQVTNPKNKNIPTLPVDAVPETTSVHIVVDPDDFETKDILRILGLQEETTSK
jgi:hypothetical protein